MLNYLCEIYLKKKKKIKLNKKLMLKATEKPKFNFL